MKNIAQNEGVKINASGVLRDDFKVSDVADGWGVPDRRREMAGVCLAYSAGNWLIMDGKVVVTGMGVISDYKIEAFVGGV
ncbi:hypothetical protein [Echinicola rosea]|uniref:hypothetical protein n=1 Tax=Echinicola rosea TaxID=1807691 RepID=UPI0010CA6788|nr:hypothetical protein [Echinicola rosea]